MAILQADHPLCSCLELTEKTNPKKTRCKQNRERDDVKNHFAIQLLTGIAKMNSRCSHPARSPT